MTQPKYNIIGVGYNTTRKADRYLLDRFYHHLDPQPQKKYLDIGCGTGNYTIALHDRGVGFTGVDPSEEMLGKARQKCATIEWMNGKVENIPAADEQFDGAVAGLTVHHWADLAAGFKELGRVLKKDARLVIFTSTPEQMERYWLNHYFPVMMRKSIVQMPSYETVERHLRQSGFEVLTTEKYFVTNELEDLFLQSGKYKPELYFDEQVRRGISTFAALSNKEEVEQGLVLLKADIASGKIQDIIREYESDTGDYLYIVARKG